MSDTEDTSDNGSPDPEDLFSEMEPGTPYTVADFEESYEASRWTIQRKLEALSEDGLIRRKKHSNRVVTWYIEID